MSSILKNKEAVKRLQKQMRGEKPKVSDDKSTKTEAEINNFSTSFKNSERSKNTMKRKFKAPKDIGSSKPKQSEGKKDLSRKGNNIKPKVDIGLTKEDYKKHISFTIDESDEKRFNALMKTYQIKNRSKLFRAIVKNLYDENFPDGESNI